VAELRPALFATAERPELAHVHLIVSSRAEEQRLPESGRRMALEGPDPAVLTRYLEHRRVRPDLARFLATACTRGRSAWLLARLIGDTHLTLTETAREEFARPLYSETGQAGALALLFDHVLDVIGAADPIEWSQNLRPVLTPLAAAGAGPVMPLSLLCAASAGFGGPREPPRVRDVLARLGRLIVRSQPGTDREVVGLFHPTLAEHLAEHARNRVDIGSGRRVLLEEINKLAPVTGLYMDNPLYRWAAEAEAEQLWQLGMIGSALQSLIARPLPTPRENLARWRSWDARVRVRLGPDDENTLLTRAGIAYWTFAAGKAREALRLSQELLPDQERVLGRHHPGTLTTRNNIAFWTGETGKATEALRLLQELLPDLERVLGRYHPDTLTTRGNIAFWTGETGKAADALRLFQQLLPDRERVLGPDHPDTLSTRGNIAFWTGRGKAADALRLFQQLLPDRERVLGRYHPDTLSTRNNIAFWTGETGKAADALRLFQQLLPDRERVLGPDHADTLSTRNNIAAWTGRTGKAAEALRLFQQLLPDRERVLGPDHPDTLTTRINIAALTGETGKAAEALRLFQELLPDWERALGPDHPDTLSTRGHIAFWTGRTGKAAEALRLFQELLPDWERALGPDHPDTLSTRGNIAFWTGETGSAE
jgi:tetratricopeptide (TPR) repeat protein